MENYLPLVVNSHCSFVLHKYDPYLLSLFNIKYLIGAEEINYFDNISKNIYRNNHPLGLGFMVNSNLLDIKLKKDDYFYNISQIYSKMLNKDLNLYYEPENPKITYDNVILDKKTNKYHFIDIKKPGYISKEYIAKENSYVVFDINKIGSKIYINDKEIPKTYQNNNQLYYYVQKGDKVKLEMPLTNDNEPQSITNIHYIKEEEYINIMNQLEKNILSNVKLNDKHIFEGQINIEEDNLLFTSIAYEKGMIIKVNGKQVKPNLILDTFVGLKLKKGNNIITIDYIPQGLILGISLSILGLIFTFIYVKTKKL